jgi:hypothetical protein
MARLASLPGVLENPRKIAGCGGAPARTFFRSQNTFRKRGGSVPAAKFVGHDHIHIVGSAQTVVGHTQQAVRVIRHRGGGSRGLPHTSGLRDRRQFRKTD